LERIGRRCGQELRGAEWSAFERLGNIESSGLITRFFHQRIDAQIMFVIDESGATTGLVVSKSGHDISARRRIGPAPPCAMRREVLARCGRAVLTSPHRLVRPPLAHAFV
jgi:hypothetical protein